MLLWIFLLSAVTNVHATLVLGYVTAEGRFTAIQLEDPNFSWSRATVDELEWPAILPDESSNSSYQENCEEHYKSDEDAEAIFINKKLKQTAITLINTPSDALRTPTVIWVPTTLWELFVIRHFALSPSFWKDQISFQSIFKDDLFDSDKNSTITPIFSEFVDYVQNYTQLKLSDLIQNPNVVAELVLKLLTDINKIAQLTPSDYPGRDRVKTFESFFCPEASAIRNGKPSLLLAIIKIEIEAHKSNSALLWRSTNGTDYCIETPNYQFSKSESPPNKKTLWKQFCSVFSRPVPSRSTSSAPLMKNRKILDFPVWTPRPIKELRLLKNEYLRSLNFSYSYSPLAGFLLDGIFEKTSACSFVFSVRDNFTYTYYLVLNKQWLLTEGKKFFFTPPFLASDGIFLRGELFHPRSKIAGLPPKFYRSEPSPFHNTLRLAEEGVELENLKILMSENFPDKSQNDIAELAKLFIASVKHNTSFSSVLTQHAKILRINLRIIEDSQRDPECQALISYQAEASELLELKLKWLYVHQQLKHHFQ